MKSSSPIALPTCSSSEQAVRKRRCVVKGGRSGASPVASSRPCCKAVSPAGRQHTEAGQGQALVTAKPSCAAARLEAAACRRLLHAPPLRLLRLLLPRQRLHGPRRGQLDGALHRRCGARGEEGGTREGGEGAQPRGSSSATQLRSTAQQRRATTAMSNSSSSRRPPPTRGVLQEEPLLVRRPRLAPPVPVAHAPRNLR